MLNQLPYLIAGAIVICLLGRWSKQNRITVLVLCCVWGGVVSSFR
jgi:hypothetical protein